MVTTLDRRKKSEIEVSTDWYIVIEYQTSKLQCNYQSYILVYNIKDAQSFSSETLTEVRTLLQETESDRSIPVIEDGISKLLYHYYKGVLYKKQTCIIDIMKVVSPQKYILQAGELGI